MSNTTASADNKVKKVLIIEDEGEMCLLLNIILDDKELELDHVKSLKTATDYLQVKNPSVVILDNKLPDGFGVDYISYIKANHPDVRIVMISGYGAAVKDVALANGADAFMEKPFTRSQIYDCIQGAAN